MEIGKIHQVTETKNKAFIPKILGSGYMNHFFHSAMSRAIW